MLVETSEDLGGSQENEKKNKDILLLILVCWELRKLSSLVMTIHDAVYVEATQEEAQGVRDLMKEEMEAAVEMPIVPLEVDIKRF